MTVAFGNQVSQTEYRNSTCFIWPSTFLILTFQLTGTIHFVYSQIRMSIKRFMSVTVACLSNVSCLSQSHVCRTFHTQSFCRSGPQIRMSVDRFIHNLFVDQDHKVACLPNVSYTIFLSIRTTNSHVCRTFHTDSLCRSEPQSRMSVERFIHNRYVD